MTIQPKHALAFALVAVMLSLFGIVVVASAVGDALEDDNIFLGSASDIAIQAEVPDCDTTTSHKLQYDQTTNALTCDSTAPGSSITTQEDNADDQTVSQIDWSTGIDRAHAAGEDVITVDPTEFGASWIDATTDLAAGIKTGADLDVVTGTAGASGNCAEWNVDGDVVDSGGACGGGGAGDAAQVEDGDNLGTFTAIDTTASFEDQGDINFAVTDGGPGGPDAITATVRANSVALGTDTTGGYAASVSEAGPATTATALAANPTDCAASNFATTIAANGDLTCAQPAFTDLSGSATDAQVPNTITIDLAATATALAADPADCAADNKADAIAASGALTCSGVDTGDITDGTILEADLAVVDAPVDEECLTYEATVGDFEWQVCGGGGANSFETHNVPAGTDPVADSSSDTLNWTSTGSTITLTGDSATDTINVEAVDVTCTDCLTATEITDVYVLNAGDAIAGGLDFNDGVTDSPRATFTPATGTPWDIFVEDATDDLQIEATTASTEVIDIVNAGAGVVDLNVDGTITGTTAVSGPNVTSGANPGHTHTTTSVSGLDVSDDLNLTCGTGCTLTGDDISVDDDYLLHAGDVATGVHDFGGATSFEVPNGAGNTVNADGEIAHDTTADQLIIGADADVISTVHQFSFTIEDPADADNFLLGKWAAYGITVTDIHCIVDPADSAESVVIDLQERGSTGDTPATLDATITCDNDGAEDDGALSNGTIDKNDWWSIDIGTVTGTVTQVVVSGVYAITRE